MIENVIVNGSSWQQQDIETLFDGEDIHFTDCTDIASLMVEIGAFPSKGQARKAGRDGEILSGWTHAFKANKKTRIFIWNPSE